MTCTRYSKEQFEAHVFHHYRTLTASLFKELRFLLIYDLCKYQLVIFVFTSCSDLLLPPFDHFCTNKYNSHYYIRSRNALNHPHTGILARVHLRNTDVHLWIKKNHNVKFSPSVYMFKKTKTKNSYQATIQCDFQFRNILFYLLLIRVFIFLFSFILLILFCFLRKESELKTVALPLFIICYILLSNLCYLVILLCFSFFYQTYC